MNVAIATTTIYEPRAVLAAYRAALPDALIVVAGDRKTDDAALRAICADLGNARYLAPDAPELARYACAAAIGYDTVSRRNLAVLEALRQGADTLICVDDDNWPLADYAAGVARLWQAPTGPRVQTVSGWWQAGAYATDRYVQRGYPVSRWTEREDCTYPKRSQSGRLGVIQSLIYGDPDISAAERLVRAPQVAEYALLPTEDPVLDPVDTWTPLNSQATLWRRATAPLACMLAGASRYDDIWAGYIAQRVLSVTDYLVSVGTPWVRQDRHGHDVVADLRAELHGMAHTEAFVAALQAIPLTAGLSVLGALGRVADGLARAEGPTGWTPPMAAFLRAWCADVAGVL